MTHWAILVAAVCGSASCGALPNDFWFVADFDSTPELCGNAFLRPLPEGDGVKSAGYADGRFGRGYAFLGPTNRCEGMFWRERRPEALSDFPWKSGAFACWYRTPEGVAPDAPTPGRQIVEVTVTGPDGEVRDESGRYAVEDGRGRVPLYLSDMDRAAFPRGWRFRVKDLTTGLAAEIW